jgi:hypothetical protein
LEENSDPLARRWCPGLVGQAAASCRLRESGFRGSACLEDFIRSNLIMISLLFQTPWNFERAEKLLSEQRSWQNGQEIRSNLDESVPAM